MKQFKPTTQLMLAGCAALGLGMGVGTFATGDQPAPSAVPDPPAAAAQPAGAASDPILAEAVPAAPDAPAIEFAVNKSGLTYGPVPTDWAGDLNQLPDLIEVFTSEMEIGYMPREALFPDPSTLGGQDMASRSASVESASTSPVYAADGETIIGDFVFGGNDS